MDTHNFSINRGYDICYSVGSARLEIGRMGSISDLLAEADSHMYEQKKRRHATRATMPALVATTAPSVLLEQARARR